MTNFWAQFCLTQVSTVAAKTPTGIVNPPYRLGRKQHLMFRRTKGACTNRRKKQGGKTKHSSLFSPTPSHQTHATMVRKNCSRNKRPLKQNCIFFPLSKILLKLISQGNNVTWLQFSIMGKSFPWQIQNGINLGHDPFKESCTALRHWAFKLLGKIQVQS